MKIKDLKNKKILILGFGLEGVSSFQYLRKKFPDKILGIADKLTIDKIGKKAQKIIQEDKKIKKYLGKDYLRKLKNYEVIIKSPGVPFKKIKDFLSSEQILTSQTKIFFNNCSGKIIGVTGTKGKSTTTSLIYKILKDSGLKSYLVGNIGRCPINLLDSDLPNNFYVYELSSHQLSDLRKSPHISIFLNIYPEHLDYYNGFKEYLRAKSNIVKYQNQNDYFIYNSKFEEIKKIAQKSKSHKIKINSVRVKESYNQNIHSLSIQAALIVSKILKIPEEKAKQSIRDFKPLPHRMEKVGEYKKIVFYNDSLSTIPESSVLALNKLGDKVETMLLGGFDRNLSFQKLTQKIYQTKIKNIILFPTTGKKIWKNIKEDKQDDNYNIFFVDNMRDAVQIAFKVTGQNRICLLSSASPSFGLFKNYKERGNLFKKYIKEYAKKQKNS